MINENFELEIRKYYSNNSKNFEALSIWVDNTLKELCYHDDLIYDFQVRQKGVESLLKKVKSQIEKGENFSDCQDVFNKINDLVGSRIMVFIPMKIEFIHHMLLNLHRVEIDKIKIHIYENDINKIAESVEKSAEEKSIPLKIEKNKTGYFGVHYILKPKPIDIFYQDANIEIFDKFELQLRTIMQHAWSEIQHKVIYKPESKPDYESYIKKTNFANLAGFVNQCDKTLENIFEHTSIFAPSYDLSAQEKEEISTSDKFEEFRKQINNLIQEFEQNNIEFSSFVLDAKRLLEEHQQDILELDKEIHRKDYLYTNFELAELYLKTHQFQKAYDLYEKVTNIELPENLQVKLLLRHSEACESLGFQSKAENKIKKLSDIIEFPKLLPEDYVICSGAAILSWRLGKYELAKDFGVKSLELHKKIDAEDDNYLLDELKYRLNLIYYYLESWSFDKNDDLPKLIALIDDIKPIYEEAQAFFTKIEHLVNSSSYDTLAWYNYHLALMHKQSGDNEAARQAISAALTLAETCMKTWTRKETELEPTPKQVWIEHARKIAQEKSVIDSQY